MNADRLPKISMDGMTYPENLAFIKRFIEAVGPAMKAVLEIQHSAEPLSPRLVSISRSAFEAADAAADEIALWSIEMTPYDLEEHP